MMTSVMREQAGLGLCPEDGGVRRTTRLLVVASIVSTGEVFETRVFTQKGQSHGPGRAVTLFAYDDFGDTFVLSLLVVHFIAVDEKR
jgi:hypothetical protein